MNDLINTTLGGMAIGEMLHRTAWLVRDTHATGRGRVWNEIGATVIDPVTGANRFLSGDASRVTDKPAEMVPSQLGGLASAGVLWRGTESGAFTAERRAIPRARPAVRRAHRRAQPHRRTTRSPS